MFPNLLLPLLLLNCYFLVMIISLYLDYFVLCVACH